MLTPNRNRKKYSRRSKRFFILVLIILCFGIWRLLSDLVTYLQDDFYIQPRENPDDTVEGWKVHNNNIGKSKNIFTYLLGKPNYYYRRRKNSTKLIVQFTTDSADENHYQHGKALFKKCHYSDCMFTNDIIEGEYADMLLFFHGVKSPPFYRPFNQIWAVFIHESPFLTSIEGGHQINWTITYSRESTIQLPYVRYVPHKRALSNSTSPRNITARSKMVAWVVSNCNEANNRLQYARALSRYISVDIFGKCGQEVDCPRGNYECLFKIIRQYRYYLAFENSNCKDYITEKLQIAIRSDTIPIVMGARPSDYMDLIPNEKYFIHVDNFWSPKHLAKFLINLADDETEYSSYFKWKLRGDVIRVNPVNEPIQIDWCDLCYRLQKSHKLVKSSSSDIKDWWSIKNQCAVDWQMH